MLNNMLFISAIGLLIWLIHKWSIWHTYTRFREKAVSLKWIIPSFVTMDDLIHSWEDIAELGNAYFYIQKHQRDVIHCNFLLSDVKMQYILFFERLHENLPDNWVPRNQYLDKLWFCALENRFDDFIELWHQPKKNKTA